GKLTPDWKDCGVIENSDYKPRAFMDSGEEAKLITDSPGDISIEAKGPGQLIVSEAYNPGWRALVDGKKERVVAFENAFLSVGLPAGPHIVHYRYRPLSFLFGLIISLTTLLTLIFLKKIKTF